MALNAINIKPEENWLINYESENYSFSSDESYLNWLMKFKSGSGKFFDLIAYCLLPNSINLFINIPNEKELFGKLKSADKFPENETYESFSAIKKTFEITGKSLIHTLIYKEILNDFKLASNHSFDSANLKLRKVNGDEVKEIINLHSMPILKGLVSDFDSWKFSSFNTICSTKPTSLNREKCLSFFHSISNFKDQHQQIVNHLEHTS